MVVVDFLGEKFALGKDDLANHGIVSLADRFPHVRRLEDRAIFVEQSLVVAEVIRVDCALDSTCAHLHRRVAYLPSK